MTRPNFINLIPRVLSLLRESTLVAAGHVSMLANRSRTEGGSSTGVDKTWGKPWPRPWSRPWPTLWPTLWPTGGHFFFF